MVIVQNNKRRTVQRIKILETQGNLKRREIITKLHGIICHHTAVKTRKLQNTESAKEYFDSEVSHIFDCKWSCSIFYAELRITLTINVGTD